MLFVLSPRERAVLALLSDGLSHKATSGRRRAGARMITLLDEDLGDQPFTGEGEGPTQAERDALVEGPEVEWPNDQDQPTP